jgi:hypothetical protein
MSLGAGGDSMLLLFCSSSEYSEGSNGGGSGLLEHDAIFKLV